MCAAAALGSPNWSANLRSGAGSWARRSPRSDHSRSREERVEGLFVAEDLELRHGRVNRHRISQRNYAHAGSEEEIDVGFPQLTRWLKDLATAILCQPKTGKAFRAFLRSCCATLLRRPSSGRVPNWCNNCSRPPRRQSGQPALAGASAWCTVSL